MGLSFSCPLASYIDLENSFQSVIEKSNILLNNDESKTHRKESDPESHVNLKSTEKATPVMGNQILISPNNSEAGVKQMPVFNLNNPKHEAAIKLQKVYKSFRTRRKLADCAVLIEQSWWKLLDFAELKRSSISFFEIEKHETAVSRWSRARTRAAKVGKGLSKNSRAQKLALQHWLEAIDPRHRYGHNLHFYYVKWLHSQSKEPFFYWLDIGEGKEVNLVDKCSRLKLQQQCIKYLGPMERKVYEVIVEDGKFLYKQSREILDTTGGPKDVKWIFVLSASMNLYVGQKKKGTFQHSSFLAGGATSAAGRIVVENGTLKAVWPHSGHYRPTPENFEDFIVFLRTNTVDLTDVKLDPEEEEEEELSSKSSKAFLRNTSSEEDLSEKDHLAKEESDSDEKKAKSSEVASQTSLVHDLRSKLTNLLIPNKDGLIEEMKPENKLVSSNLETFQEEEENREEGIPKEVILERINSHKGMNSYQLGKQLSFKWTTGAGPRIGCLRDYPPRLQFRCLEKAKLSPRGCGFQSMSSLDDVLQDKLDIGKTCSSKELRRTNLNASQNSPLSIRA